MYFEPYYEELRDDLSTQNEITTDGTSTCTSATPIPPHDVNVVFVKQPHALDYIQKTGKHCKLLSKEISIKSARKFPVYGGIGVYWKHVNKITNNGTKLHRLNDHEVLAPQSIFRGIFYDVDYDLLPNGDNPMSTESYNTLRNDLLDKIEDFNQIIIQGAFMKTSELELETDSSPVILIQEASKSGKKLSFHINITHPQIVFKTVYVIKAIIAQAALACMQEHGYEFFIASKKSWLDLAVYENKKSIRTLYSSKLADTTRPLLPIIKITGEKKVLIDSLSSRKLNLQYLKDSIICVPSLDWLLHEDPPSSSSPKNDKKKIYVQDLRTKEDSGVEYTIDYPEDDPHKNPDKDNEALCDRIYVFVTAVTAAMVSSTNFYSSANPNDMAYSPGSSLLFNELIKNQPLDNQLFVDELSKFILIQDSHKRQELVDFTKPLIHQSPVYYKYINLNLGGYTAESFCKLSVEDQMQEATNSIVFEHYYVVFRSKTQYCYLKGDSHEHNHVCFVVELISRQWWQNCLSPSCVDAQRALKESLLLKNEPKKLNNNTFNNPQSGDNSNKKSKRRLEFKTKKPRDTFQAEDVKEKTETAKGTRFQIQLDDPMNSVISQRLATVARIIFVSELAHNQHQSETETMVDNINKTD
jgi:hypothetical protein